MNQDPLQLLNIASQHIKALPESGFSVNEPKFSTEIDHALQAIILSAIAVEAAVNIALALPITGMRDHTDRRYAASMLKVINRSNIRQKIKLLLDNNPEFNLTPDEKKQAKFLFECRNKIVHSTPEYKEEPATKENTAGMSQQAVEDCGDVVAFITTSSRSSAMLDDARNCFDSAHLLVHKLMTFKYTNPTSAHILSPAPPAQSDA
jgi:hypothetical protein